MNRSKLQSTRWASAAALVVLATWAMPASASESDRPPDGTVAPSAAGATATRATYMTLIQELQAQGQSYAALAHIAQYEARWGGSPDTQVLRADALRATGQDAAAAQAYRQLLDGARAAAGHRGLGLMAAMRGQWEPAIEHLAAASRLDPTDGRTLGDLGYAQLRAGRTEQARVPLMTAAQLLPTDSRTLANLASYFIAAGQHAQADAVLRSPHVTDNARASVRGPDRAASVASAGAAALGSSRSTSTSTSTSTSMVAPTAPTAPAAPPTSTAASTVTDTPAPALRLAHSLAFSAPAQAGAATVRQQGDTP